MAARSRPDNCILWHNKVVQFPLSNDEHAAMARYLLGIRKQLQDVSDLFKTRYGTGSDIAQEAVRALASAVRLERDFLHLEEPKEEILTVVEEVGFRPN